MRLRLRMFVIVGITVGVLLAAVFVVASAALLSEFDGLEQQAAVVDADRVRSALDDDIRQLDRAARDLAPRDATYSFMRGTDPAYAAEYLSKEALVYFGADLVAFVGQDGTLTRAESVDLDLGESVKPDAAVLDAILKAEALRGSDDPRAQVSGLLAIPDGVMLVSARAITTSDMNAAPAGTLVLGRYLDAVQLSRLASVTRLAIDQFPLSRSDVPTDVRRALSALEASGSDWSQPLSEDRMGAYTLVRDVNGDPALVLRADLPRSVHRQGQSAVGYLAVSMLVIGAAATLSVFGVVDRGVLLRLKRLSRQLADITSQRDLSARVTAEGSDELGGLAAGVNDMLTVIEVSERELTESRDELEVRVRERTHELRASESRYRTLIERMADAVFSVDPQGVVTFANDRAKELTGRSGDQLVGLPFRELMTPASADVVERRVNARRTPKTTLSVEAHFLHERDGAVPVELRAGPLLDDDRQVAGIQWIVHDIAQRKRYEEELVHVASHDHLTGLFNRRYFEESLERELSQVRRSGSRGAVLWLDVDDFKDVNDSLGHRAGDEVLVELADQLRQQVREYNVLARLGGDEFGVLVPDVGPEEAEGVADRVLSAVNSRTYSAAGHAIRVGASMGMVLFPLHGVTVEELLAKADGAMYMAKSAGRSRIHMHRVDESTDEGFRSRMEWNERLVHALEEDLFTLYAQPLLDLRTHKVVRHELLIRLTDDSGQIVLPAEFLPTAERLGLIRDVDRWVLRQAVDLLAACPDQSIEFDVNLSGKAFGDTGLLASVAQELRDAGIEPRRLGFELTETAAIADILRAQEFICTLSDIGCRFSLDDFGSGFSSFYYLKHLPIDCLKIDGSLIRGLAHGDQDRHLVRGIVELCRGLGIEVTAEYVENPETLEAVEGLGIDYAQGHHIGRPVPVAEALGLATETLAE